MTVGKEVGEIDLVDVGLRSFPCIIAAVCLITLLYFLIGDKNVPILLLRRQLGKNKEKRASAYTKRNSIFITRHGGKGTRLTKQTKQQESGEDAVT